MKQKVPYDLHGLVGQVLNERLRVVQLSYVSARQWLYEVEPPSVGKTRRALKVLGHPSGREPGSFYRLKTTLDRLKGLRCPQIEEIYEVGVLHDLTPYLVSEWEPHQSLYELLRHRRAPLKWFEAQSVLIDICKGLKALHSKGVSHGDLRAQHVLLRQECSDAFLIDFAVSGAFGAPPSQGLERSLAYWAPERLIFASATPSTDMYSFGVLAYLCLEGRLPFSPPALNPDDPQDPLRTLTELHHTEEVSEMSSETPEGVKELVRRCLVKDPYQRPATIDELLSVLINPNVKPSSSLAEAEQHAALALEEGDPWEEAISLELSSPEAQPMAVRAAAAQPRRAAFVALMISSALAAPLALALHRFLF